MVSEVAALRSTESFGIPLLTVVRFVVRKCIHARGIELGHVSLAIDDFLSEVPRDWSLDGAYQRTGSLRCMQYLAARGPKQLQSYYRSWITNNVIEMALKKGDVQALKWLAEVYAPDVSMTRAAELAAGGGRLDVLQWLDRNHRNRVDWGGAEWCEAVRTGQKDVVEWLRHRGNPHEEVAPQLMLDAARAGDLPVLQLLCDEFALPVSNAFVEAQRGAQWGIAKWILMNCEL